MALISWSMPAPSKGVAEFIADNRECRLRLHMSVAGSTFVGGSVSAALSLPNIDFSNPAKLEGDVGVEAGGFVGAQAKGKLSIGVQWSPGKITDYKTIGEVAPEASASAGLGVEFKWKIEYSKDRFRFIASAGLAFGLGCRGGFNFELNLHEGVKFIGHLMNSVDFHKVAEITGEAYKAFSNCSFTLMVKGALLMESGALAASDLIDDIDAWLFTRKSDMTAPKRNLLEASAHRSQLRFYPPEALGKSLIGIMATREDADFRAILWILYSSDSAHKLKWILRIASQDPFRGSSVVESQRNMANALQHGIEKIRAFGAGPDPRNPRMDFIHEFNALLKAKGIDG